MLRCCCLLLLSSSLAVAAAEETSRSHNATNATHEAEKQTEKEQDKQTEKEQEHSEKEFKHDFSDAEKKHEDAKPAAQPAGNTALAVSLLGGMVMVMAILHAVHTSDEFMSKASWGLLSSSFSIFSGSLMCNTVTALLSSVWKPTGVVNQLAQSFLIMIVFVLIFEYMCIHFRNDPHKNAGGVGPRVAAFGAVNFFTFVQMALPHDNALKTTAAFVIGCVFFGIFWTCTSLGRDVVAKDWGMTADVLKLWDSKVMSGENNVTSLSMGFVLMQVGRYCVLGKLVSAAPFAFPKDVTNTQSFHLLLISLIAIAIQIILIVLNTTGKLKCANPIAKRCFTLCEHTLATVLAWNVIFWSEIRLYLWDLAVAKLGGIMLVAFSLTFLSWIALWALHALVNKLKDDSTDEDVLNGAEFAQGLIVGFSWGRVFGMAIGLTAQTESDMTGMAAPLASIILSVILLIAVCPAWHHHILPRTLPPAPDTSPRLLTYDKVAGK